MVLKKLFAWLFGGWPTDLPRFYPNLDELQLAQFLSDAEYQRIKVLENFYIMPFVSKHSSDMDAIFGLGLAQLMIRNLMLLRDVSVHGPEDTSSLAYEEVQKLAAAKPSSSYVTGIADCKNGGFRLHVDMYRRGGGKTSATVEEREFASFLQQCTVTIGRLMGSSLQPTVADAWTVGQPSRVESLQRCGDIELRFAREDTQRRAAVALEVLPADTAFAVPAWHVDNEIPGARATYLEALKRDPYNAQLHFLTFCMVWKSKRPQPEAVQYCRKAIEFSPGHGKAHMCAPHAAPAQADMLRHSELGYRLLPGNSFAINNYILSLNRYGAPPEKLIELAEEGIEMDPSDPSSYSRLIELHCNLGDVDAALRVAKRLQKLYEPKINERTLYCLRQNPEMARMIDSGEYDPAANNRRLIGELKRIASQRG